MVATSVPRGGRGWLFAQLDGAPVLGHIGPNWFTAVMGTGIVSVAILGSPVAIPGDRAVAGAFWALSVLLLVVISGATGLHHYHHPAVARGHWNHPVMAHFYGAPAMGIMTVGSATLLVGIPGAVAIDSVLLTLGTLLGLATAVLVPLRMWARPDCTPAVWWLMPVVPPFVSATGGALLAPDLPAGFARTGVMAASWACFAISCVYTVRLLPLIATRVYLAGLAVASVPTLWIALGPFGQSSTAVAHLHAPHGLAIAFLVPVCSAAVLFFVVLVVATVRARPPFALTWWAFTFPVGTMATGTAALADLTGWWPVEVGSTAVLAALVAAWALVVTLTVRGTLTGELLQG